MQKVVIIGAGPAGLSTAYELLKNDNKKYKVILLEKEKQVGGISKTINYKGNRMDLGGHRFFSKDEKVNEFWQDMLRVQGKPSYDDKVLEREYKVEDGGPDPEKEDKVMLIRHRISRIYYLKKFFDYPVKIKYSTFKNMGLKRTVKSMFSYSKSIVVKKDESSLENFYINRFGKSLYSMFFEKYTEKLWGRHPRDISSDWGAQRVKGLSIIGVLKDALKIGKKKETSLIEEYYYPKYGPGQLWETTLDKIIKLGGEIKYESKVVEIKTKNNSISSLIIDEKGKRKEIDGDIFISSMPIKDLIDDIDGKVPKNIKEIATNLPYRSFVTIGLLLKKLKLENNTNIRTINDIVPDCWIYVQEPEVKLGRIQIFNNWSPYLVSNKDKDVWIGLEYFCDENDSFWNMTDEETSNFAIQELIKMNVIDKEDVLDYHVERVEKAYPAYFDTYKDIDKVIDYLNKYDNLYCIGRNGQHRYNNMDHSMITGFETANNIINNVKDKSNIWNVNTEKEYHEEKNK
jgi:protoporphyrinogen oxidase